MKAEEIRLKLTNELQAQFSKTDIMSFAPKKVDDCIIKESKPMMFMPKSNSEEDKIISDILAPVKGIGFKNTTDISEIRINDNQEIYNMKELIGTNPENMRTISYDENVVKAQLALVKKKEWQDILFDDVDWFMKIDLTFGIKKLFKII